MKYFTKKYIREADCKEIQDLRKELRPFDFICDSEPNNLVFYMERLVFKCLQFVSPIFLHEINEHRESYTWLPTGDQLDEEIVKICEKKGIVYIFRFNPFVVKNKYRVETEGETTEKILTKWSYNKSDNPLIAKIKLLKQLLEAK